jgi:AbiU2
MSGLVSEDEVRARCIAAMGTPLGEVYYWLYDEVTWLHVKWKDLRALFASPRQTIDLLNASAPTFFANLQVVLWEDALLHLARLTDPVQSRGKSPLTVRRFPELISDPDLRRDVQSLADEANTKTAFARDWRNRKLAHTELPPLDGQPPKPLARASFLDVETSLDAIRRTMNCIARHYLDTTVGYEHVFSGLGGVELLLLRLRNGLRFEAIQRDSPDGF